MPVFSGDGAPHGPRARSRRTRRRTSGADAGGVRRELHPQLWRRSRARALRMFAVSKMLGETRPTVRQAAGRSPWDIAAMGKPEISLHAGKVTVVSRRGHPGHGLQRRLRRRQGLSARLGGLEDIPRAWSRRLTASPVDLLSTHRHPRAPNTSSARGVPVGGWAVLDQKRRGRQDRRRRRGAGGFGSELGVAAAASAGRPAHRPVHREAGFDPEEGLRRLGRGLSRRSTPRASSARSRALCPPWGSAPL